MDPKEYRKVFRRALGFIRDVEKASGATFPLLADFEAAYEAEIEATEALQREVSKLTKVVADAVRDLHEKAIEEST